MNNRSTVSVVLLVLVMNCLRWTFVSGNYYDSSNLQRGSRVLSGCSERCCGGCRLQFYHTGTIGREQSCSRLRSRSQCESICNKLGEECDLGCTQAMEIDTVDRSNGCGCTTAGSEISKLKTSCSQACDVSTKQCTDGCVNDESSSIKGELDIMWERKVNGTCGAVCDPMPSMEACDDEQLL